jgi:hypothetical protein
MSGHVRLEKSTKKIHGHPKKQNKSRKNEQPTMGVLPTVPHKLDQNSIRETQRYYHMKTMIPHVTKILQN